MKNLLKSGVFIGFILLLNTLPAMAQKAKDIFNSSETPVTWFGIDFSEAKLIGDAAADPMSVRAAFAGINQVIVNEPKKYDLPSIFRKTTMPSDITAVLEKNGKINTEQIQSSNTADETRFTKATVDGIIKNYKFGGQKGIGLMFVMESMSKTAQQASMYVTFFDIASRKVILTERMVGKAGGFGFRNYWTGAINKVLIEINKNKYKEWKSNNP